MDGVTATGRRWLAAAAAAALLSGCQTVREQETAVAPEVAHAYLADKPNELKKHFYVKLVQGKRNDVLNDMRLGLAAMEMGHTALAEDLLDEALANIETVYADNEHAAKARSLFVKEAAKDFKGEPYERAMAYYYRGLLYLKAGDYDNARASFKAGFIQDSFAEEDQHRADFGLLAYLQGWASRCRGNAVTADDDFREFRTINETFPLPGPDDNVLLLAETGSAPVKFGGTDANSSKAKYLKLRRASATESARVNFTETLFPGTGKKGGKPAEPQTVDHSAAADLLEDVYRQASTRGGREFDSILAGKAQFKQVTGTVGDAALAGAVVAASYSANSRDREQQQNAAAAAGVLLLVGLMAKAASEAAEAEADTRYWDNLPDRVHGLPLKVPAGIDRLTVEFLTPDGEVVRSKAAAIVRAGACGLAWVRGDSAFPWSPRAPYSAPAEAMSTPVEIPPLPAAKPAAAPASDTDRRPSTPGDQAP